MEECIQTLIAIYCQYEAQFFLGALLSFGEYDL